MFVSTLAVAPTDSNTVYAGYDMMASVYVTTNALAGVGAIWNNQSIGLPQRYITQVTVDPHVSTTAYVALSGFQCWARVSHNGWRAPWKDISGNLPNIPVNAIAIDPVLANTYYAATDIGVFRTRNGGVNWATLGDGFAAGDCPRDYASQPHPDVTGIHTWSEHVGYSRSNRRSGYGNDGEPKSSVTWDQSQIYVERHQ